MIEITIAQALVVALALIVATIVIAQPFRKKVVHNTINLDTRSHRSIIEAIFQELQNTITERFAPLVADYTRMKETKVECKCGEGKPKIRKSRAGETRKPSTLPKNATAEEKRLFKNRMKTRAYRAKKRAELKK